MSAETSSVFPSGMDKPVCVFCGSSPGKSPIHADAARAVGQAMASANMPLVYGGGRRGIMGVVSQATLEAGGHVHGIVPRALMTRASERTSAPTVNPVAGSGGASQDKEKVQSAEGAGEDLVDSDYDGRMTLSVVDSMHERKMKMAQLSTGGFIVLPGGYGTFEEALEMITWNQLKIHQLPVVILNIDNFYTPLQTLFTSASSSGFINPENLSLVKIVDLPGGEKDNADPSKAGEWGQVAVDAIKKFTFSAGAGYNLSWKTEGEGESNAAWAYFTKRDGTEVWGDWPGDENVWERIKDKVEHSEREGGGDWRVRVVLHKDGQVEVQLIAASPSAGRFDLTLPPLPTQPRRRLVLSPSSTSLPPLETPFRLFKTTHRPMYTAPLAPYPPGTEVLLHTGTHLLETCTSNIALHLPDPDRPEEAEWVTPALRSELEAEDGIEGEGGGGDELRGLGKRGDTAEFLAGTVRAELIERGVVRVGQVSLGDWERCKREGRGVVGFNGFVGVWAAEFD
ncbi:uncharacterized protein MKK02DRAFT_42433 [Dioszegia hungarica]|uniref:Lysine decarboxylase n=1 Tax=Dioszegia hungarica TaxID=4972 RepID=A0AA38HFH7_9TREE|nr:uncharacterized protein MKK02DRAFT_42433 [Dioszegia hungarica]KAI9638051.1 hypothetical protein MKK02DRAFT_42433 [Dioszegia hungarica]